MKILITILTCLVALSSYAQKFTGKATYKTHKKISISFGDKKNAPSKLIQDKLAAQMKKMSQKTFTLNFNKFESTYKENESLDAPNPQAGLQVVSMGGSNTEVLYKNIRENKYVKQTDIMGKNFLIKDNIKNINWQLSDETKNIGIYTCYKATFSKEVEEIDFTVFGSNEKQKSKPKQTKKVVTTAWYTPQIPVSNGPQKYGGLPGLILELRQGKLTIVCSEVVINPSDKIEIKQPTKGKKVSQKEYNKIQNEKSKEMMERYRSKGRNKNSIEIKIQG